MDTIKDFKTYLDHIDKLSKTLSKEKRKKLENILEVILTLLICMKKSSNLGKYKLPWEE